MTDEIRRMTAPPMRIRLFAWWGGYVQGTGCGVIALGVFTTRSVWPFIAGLALLLAGWLIDERVGRYARGLL